MVTTGTEIGFRNIVIVEDDEDISDSIRYNLEREGFRVRVAHARRAHPKAQAKARRSFLDRNDNRDRLSPL